MRLDLTDSGIDLARRTPVAYGIGD